MTDRDVSMGRLVAFGLWVLGGLLVAWGASKGSQAAGWAGLGVLFGASTATIRVYLVDQNVWFKQAFDLGRAQASEAPPVPPLQSVN